MKFLNSIDGASKIITDSNNQFVTQAEKDEIAKVKDKADKAKIPNKTSQLTNDSGYLTNVTKSDVGLSNVDNVKQMPISGGILENYREKLLTLSGTSTTINLNNGNVFTHTLSGNTTYSISNAQSQAHSFTLIINQTETVRTITFPANIKWQDGEIPDLSTASKTYVLTFMTVNGGTTWFELNRNTLGEDTAGQIMSIIGELSYLLTDDKSSVVNSINELVGAINELFINVSDAKELIAAELTDKKIQASSDDTFEKLSLDIRQVRSVGSTKKYSTYELMMCFGFDPVRALF